MCLVFCTAGCEGKTQRGHLVVGEVTWDDEPILDGNITFIPTDGSVLRDGAAIKNGKYSLRSEPGEKRVEIFATKVIIPAEPGRHGEEREQYIPARYNQASTLTAEVQPNDNNRLSFQLSDRP